MMPQNFLILNTLESTTLVNFNTLSEHQHQPNVIKKPPKEMIDNEEFKIKKG